MKNKTLLEKLDLFLGEAEDNGNSKIDWKQVREAMINAAKDIFDDPDEKIIDDMISTMKKENKAKDTEDAIQIGINMMRSED